MFSNMHQAKKEIDCYKDSIYLAHECLKRNKFDRAATHYEDAIRSLKELHQLKEEKENGQVRLVGTILGSRRHDGR